MEMCDLIVILARNLSWDRKKVKTGEKKSQNPDEKNHKDFEIFLHKVLTDAEIIVILYK